MIRDWIGRRHVFNKTRRARDRKSRGPESKPWRDQPGLVEHAETRLRTHERDTYNYVPLMTRGREKLWREWRRYALFQKSRNWWTLAFLFSQRFSRKFICMHKTCKQHHAFASIARNHTVLIRQKELFREFNPRSKKIIKAICRAIGSACSFSKNVNVLSSITVPVILVEELKSSCDRSRCAIYHCCINYIFLHKRAKLIHFGLYISFQGRSFAPFSNSIPFNYLFTVKAVPRLPGNVLHKYIQAFIRV